MEVVHPDPPLSDGVVSLRPWEDGDVDALVAGINRDPEITAWLELIPQPYTVAEARMWINLAGSMWVERTGSPFALVVNGDAVGGVGINWIDRDQAVGDIGYWLRQDARGRGYTTRGVVLAARWAFEIGCERLQLRADAENEPSQRVAERAGFTREGVQRSARYNPRLNRRMNFVVYSLLPGELWPPQRRSRSRPFMRRRPGRGDARRSGGTKCRRECAGKSPPPDPKGRATGATAARARRAGRARVRRRR